MNERTARRKLKAGGGFWPWITALVLLSVASGCDGDGLDVDFQKLTPIPEVQDVDFGAVVPAQSWEYWELRFQVPFAFDSVVGSGGRGDRNMLPPAVVMELDSLQLQFGFAFECLPGACFKFIAAVDGDSVTVFATTQGLADFLGPFDDVAEAIISLDAAGYHWDRDGARTGYRADENGWEFVALQLVRDCAPVQTDRVLVRVSRVGSLRVIDREVFEKLENACV